MSLLESLERAANELSGLAEPIGAAQGDPDRLLESLETQQAAEVLIWVLLQAPESAAELVDAWGEWEKGAEVLLNVSDEALSERGVAKPGRKILRKAHHRLRSRGIEVKAQSTPPAAKRRVVAVEDPFEAAALSVPDFRGARVGYLADRHPAGGARLFEIRFDEARGILAFKVYNAGRSKVRGFLRSLSSAQEQRLFDVPRKALCALVRRASLAQPADRPLPSGFVEWRGRVFPETLENEATPGGLVREALAADAKPADSGSQVDEVVAQIADGRVGPWPPPTQWISDWMDKGREQTSGLDAEARANAIAAWRQDVTDALAAFGDASLLKRHLEEWAWVQWQTEGLEAASAWVAVADAIESDPALLRKLAEARVESLFAPFLEELATPDVAESESAASNAS